MFATVRSPAMRWQWARRLPSPDIMVTSSVPISSQSLSMRGHGTPGAPPLRVLVVDDNVDGAEGLCAVLTSMGCETSVAFDGAHGFAAAAIFDPDLALIDLEMPDMGGCDLARKLRAAPAPTSARLICLTGRGHPEDRRLCMEAGFDEFFTKPIRLESLVQEMAAANPASVCRPGMTT